MNLLSGRYFYFLKLHFKEVNGLPRNVVARTISLYYVVVSSNSIFIREDKKNEE